MVTCRQCGATHRDDSVTQCASCGSTYFKTVDLWNQAYADLGRRMVTDSINGRFPFWPMAWSFLKRTLALYMIVALLVLLAARMS